MRILVKQNGTVCADLRFEEEVVYIGSKAGSSICLPDPQIAPQHALLAPDDEENWHLAPASAQAATLLNGQAVTARTPVRPGDRIGIGEYDLLVESEEFQAVKPWSPSDEIGRDGIQSLPLNTIFKAGDEGITLSGRRFQHLSRINFNISQCRDIRSLLDMTLTSLLQAFLDPRLAWVGVRRQDEGRLEFVEGRLTNGSVADDPPLLDLLYQRCMERSLMICVPRIESQEFGSLMAVPLISTRGTLGMLYVDSEPGSGNYRERHLHMLIGIASQVTQQLEAIIDNQLRAQAAMSSGQTTLANQVQARLDPKGLPQWPSLQIAAYCKPGQDVASDVYDILKLSGGGAGILIAKARSNPVDTLLMMTETRAAFRVACLHKDSPHTFLRELNWLLYDEREQRRLDAVVVMLDPPTGRVRYATAGTCYAVIVDVRGEPRPLTKHHGPPVGESKSPDYASVSEVLKPGESLALFTPGITATTNSKGKTLSANKVVESLCDGFAQPAGNILDDLVMDLSDYLKSGRQPEDISLLLVHREDDVVPSLGD